MNGLHLIADLHDCRCATEFLFDAARLESFCVAACTRHGLTVVGRPLLEVEILRFKRVGIDLVEPGQERTDFCQFPHRGQRLAWGLADIQAFGSMSRKRSAISTRRGYLRCMAMPSQ